MEEDGFIPELYGRRQGKPLKPRQARLMETLLPVVAVPAGEAALDLPALFPGKDEFALEIGFGGGEHLVAQAAARPLTGFLGAEPFVNGVAKLLAKIDAAGLDNIRVLFGDARPLLRRLPDRALAAIFVLFPDPWPKKRHFKRRLISPWFLGEAARLLQPGGRLRVASDIPDYVRWTLMHAQGAPALSWTAETPDDWRRRPADWPATRYEEKARAAGRDPVFLEFRRM
jgi:tRNA (guanine-N7-)-methyltransferase